MTTADSINPSLTSIVILLGLSAIFLLVAWIMDPSSEAHQHFASKSRNLGATMDVCKMVLWVGILYNARYLFNHFFAKAKRKLVPKLMKLVK